MATVLYLREPVHLGLHQPLFFIFIIDFAVVTFRVGKYITIIIYA